MKAIGSILIYFENKINFILWFWMGQEDRNQSQKKKYQMISTHTQRKKLQPECSPRVHFFYKFLPLGTYKYTCR